VSNDITTLQCCPFLLSLDGSGGPDTAMKLNKCFYNADPEVR